MAIKRPPRRAGGALAALAGAAVLLLAAFLLLQFSNLSLLSLGLTARQASTAVAADGQQTASLDPPSARQPKPKVTDAIRQRCAGTLGTWCIDYHTQQEVPARTAPRGNKTCSLDCNQVGVCDALTGLCTCPAGWTGFHCLHPMKRRCTHKWRRLGFERPHMPANLSAGIGLVDITQLTRSHCAGECDEDIAACFCPSNTTHGRIPAPEDAPQGSPPVRVGRPMNAACQPNKLPDGTPTRWGWVDPEKLFGPDGWCMAEKPKHTCDCPIPGLGGKTCDEPIEQFCPNQCNGRGTCLYGYCKCDEGWHGIDCAHCSMYADGQQPGLEEQRPWIKPFVHTPAARDFAPGETRKRPLIYVYNLPSEYASLMLQYRHHGSSRDNCVPRYFGEQNFTALSGFTYTLESGFLEQLLQSGHRTLNPDAADYFYVPVFTSCFIFPVRDGADSLHDFFYSVGQNRVQGASNMLLEAYHWIRSHHPYWDRRGGRDHIWLVTHDEGSCWVPSVIRPSIILSHWGRKDVNHTSGTAYDADNYSMEYVHPQYDPKGFQRRIAGHPCYDPHKDLIMPLMKTPDHFHRSPLLGGRAHERKYLAFHRGRVQHQLPGYSRGIRQRLANASAAGNWFEKHNILVGECVFRSSGARAALMHAALRRTTGCRPHTAPPVLLSKAPLLEVPACRYEKVEGDYSELLASSVFCLVLAGDGWSARMDDAVLNGCIPTIIIDNVDVSFESILDLTAFTVRIPQADAEKLPEILLAIPEERRLEMQRNLAKVWSRFTYSSYRPYAQRIRQLQQENGAGAAGAPQLSLPPTVPDLDPDADDAFGTVMAWLYGRLEATR
ncbi:hypothetical protein ABPG75_001757 [Micractinium tetrahymenae]